MLLQLNPLLGGMEKSGTIIFCPVTHGILHKVNRDGIRGGKDARGRRGIRRHEVVVDEAGGF